MFAKDATVHVNPEFASSYPARARVEGTTYQVLSKGPKNYKLKPVSGSGVGTPGILAPEYVLVAGPAPETGSAIGIPFVPEAIHDPGTVVRFKNPTRESEEGLHVVTGYAGKGHQVFPLGGSNRYQRNVSGNRLIALDVSLIQDAGIKIAVTLTPKES